MVLVIVMGAVMVLLAVTVITEVTAKMVMAVVIPCVIITVMNS